MGFENNLQQRYNRLLEVSGRWDSITPSRRLSYERTLRRTLNDIVKLNIQQANLLPDLFVNSYNELVDKFKNKVPFNIEKLTGDPEKFLRIRNAIDSNMNRGAVSSFQANQQKREFMRQAINSITQENIDLFKPRITLLDIAGARQIQTRRQIIGLINRGLDRGIPRPKVVRTIFNRLNDIYPDGSIIAKDKNGNNYSLPLDTYSEMWVSDIQAIVNNQSTLGYMKRAQLDLVRITGPRDSKDICTQTWTGKRVYSISGKNPNFPKMTVYPPLHPNCEHGTEPASENFTEKNLRINDDIFGSGQSQRRNKVFSTANKEAQIRSTRKENEL